MGACLAKPEEENKEGTTKQSNHQDAPNAPTNGQEKTPSQVIGFSTIGGNSNSSKGTELRLLLLGKSNVLFFN